MEKETKAKKNKGGFFAVDKEIWQEVIRASKTSTEEGNINLAVAFLVIASGTQSDNRTTSWSARSVRKYARMRWSNADNAIQELVRFRLVEQTKRGAKPRYKIRKGKKDAPKIWLPNEIITGAKNEIPPIAKLRSTRDIDTLRLFIDLYFHQNLDEEGGIDRRILSKEYTKEFLAERGEFLVHSFEEGEISTRITWKQYSSENWKDNWKEVDVGNDETELVEDEIAPFWERLYILSSLGLFQWVPFLFEDNTDESEPIHPCFYKGDKTEKELAIACQEAAKSILKDAKLDGCNAEDCLLGHELLVPVPKHMAKVHMVGIARLRYRPKTSKTSKWYGRFLRSAKRHLEQYNKIIDRFSGVRAVSGDHYQGIINE